MIGAVVLRIVLTFFAVQLLLLPYLQLVGAALLRLDRHQADRRGRGRRTTRSQASDRLVAAVKTVIVADLVMSLDNVIGVAGAAKGSLLLLVFGLVVSIPLVVVGSQLIMKLIERFPWLVVAGGGLLGYIAGEIATEDAAVKPWIDANAPVLHYACAGRRASSSSSPSACGSTRRHRAAATPERAARAPRRRSRDARGAPVHAQRSQQWRRPVKLAA